MNNFSENEIAKIVIDQSFQIHQELGPGLLESVYESILELKLRSRGLQVESQVDVPICYEELIIEKGFRADLIIEQSLIVELKSVREIPAVAYKQLLTYLKLSGKRLGLLINFGSERFKGNAKRIVNGLPDEMH